jgi:hypothetical protein
MYEMKTGEVCERLGSVTINGILCHELRIIDPGKNPLVAAGTEYMLMDSELKRNVQ